jgi:hypothetical protein
VPRLLPALAALAALAACRSSGGPAEAYRAFAAATRAGDEDQAWARLSERSRAALDARAKEVAARTGGVTPAMGKDLLVGDATSRAPRIEDVVVLRESADAAVVRVTDRAGAERDVTLVRERGAWRVVLPDFAADQIR